jgi:hypothetical protein
VPARIAPLPHPPTPPHPSPPTLQAGNLGSQLAAAAGEREELQQRFAQLESEVGGWLGEL